MLDLHKDRLKIKLCTTSRRSTYVIMGGILPSALTDWSSPSAVMGRSSTSAWPSPSVSFHPRRHAPSQYTNIDFERVYHWSTTTHTCVLGRNSHKTSQFSSNMGTGLIENGDMGVEIHLRFPSQASQTLIINYIILKLKWYT